MTIQASSVNHPSIYNIQVYSRSFKSWNIYKGNYQSSRCRALQRGCRCWPRARHGRCPSLSSVRRFLSIRASSIQPSSIEEDGTERRKKKRRATLDPYLATRGAWPPERKVVSSMLTVLDDWFTRAIGAHRKVRSSALASWWTQRASVIVGWSSSVIVHLSIVEHPSINHQASERRPLSIQVSTVEHPSIGCRLLSIQASTSISKM